MEAKIVRVAIETALKGSHRIILRLQKDYSEDLRKAVYFMVGEMCGNRDFMKISFNQKMAIYMTLNNSDWPKTDDKWRSIEIFIFDSLDPVKDAEIFSEKMADFIESIEVVA